jgi:hypothetical protein
MARVWKDLDRDGIAEFALMEESDTVTDDPTCIDDRSRLIPEAFGRRHDTPS